MGYSSSAYASYTMVAVADLLRGKLDTNNGIERNGGFWEIGRENWDGAMTGTVWKMLPDGVRARRAGTFRIEADGHITRFPTLTKAERLACEKAGQERYASLYGFWLGPITTTVS